MSDAFIAILFVIVSGVIGWLFVRFVCKLYTEALKRLAKLKRQPELERQPVDHHQARPAPKAPPQLPQLPTFSPLSVSLSLSVHSDQPTPPRSPTPQAPSHHVHHPAATRNIAAVAFSSPPGTTTDENGDALLLGVQGSTTAREDLNMNENVNANAILRRRPVPVVDNTIHEHSVPLLGAHSSAIAREPTVNEHVNSTATLPRSPVAFDNSNNNGSEHHQGTAVPTQDSRLRLEPSVTVPPSPSPSGVSRSDVDEWRKVVALGLDEERRRHGQDQPMGFVVDGRPLPSSVVPTLPLLPSLVPPPAVLDTPNPDTLSTHVITDPSDPSSASSAVFTLSPQLPPLHSSTISTNAGANGASGTTGPDTPEVSVLDPWNGAIATQDGELNVPASVSSAAQAATASLQTDGSGDSSSTSQLVTPNASRVSPQLPPFSPLSSIPAPTQSNQPTSFKSQSPPQTPYTPPYLLTSSAQHPHYSSPSNIAALASSSTTSATTTAPPAAIAPTHSHPSKPSPPASAVLSLSQSDPISPDPTCSFRSSPFSEPFDLVVPESPGPFGSPGTQGSIRPPTSLQSPFIPLSPLLPISPVPPGAGGNGTGGDQQQRQRKPLSLLGSASSVMTTTARQSSSLNPPPPTSSARSMFYSSTDDGSTSRQTSPTSLPARLPPPHAVQPDGVLLSFPSEINPQQQHRFASPGIMSPVLSELDFVSEFGGSNDDDIGSESSWSSDSCRDAHT